MPKRTIYVTQTQEDKIKKMPYDFNLSAALRPCIDQILAQVAKAKKEE